MPHRAQATRPAEGGALPYGPAKTEGGFSSDFFRKFFQSSSDAIVLLSAKGGECLDLNPRASATFGYAREEFLRLPPRRAICTLNE